MIFEDIEPWIDGTGDTGLSARQKLKRNFELIKSWADSMSTLVESASGKYLSKTDADTAAEVITFVKGLIAQSKSYMQDVDFGTFVADSTGGAIYQKDGNWYFEGDFFHIRKKLTAESVEIQHTSHIGGKIIQSAADMVVYKVEEDDTSYKCYFLKKDSDGNIIYNKFKTLDQGLCETFNLTTSADGTAGNHYYWRLVTAVDDGTEDMCWIKLSKTDMADGSDAPLVGDKISQLGYRGTDSDKSSRTGANIQSGAGDAGSPYYRCYENITSYTLPSPSAQFSPNGSWITVTDSDGNSIAIQELLDSMQSTIATVKQQTDKQFDIWFVDEAPTLTNAPYTDWLATDTTNSNTEARDAHVDDLAYCAGKGYRFTVSNSVYAWADETDKDVLQALTNAANAQKTADEKIRCYVAQPGTDDVYDVGDQWVNATYPTGTDTITLDGVEYTADNPLYSNDSLVCITAKAKGTAFNIEHWQASSSTTAAALRVMKDGIVAVVTKNKTDTDTAIAAIENLTNTESSLYKNISANSTDITSVSKELATTEKSLATLSTNYSGTVTTLTSVSTVVNNITATAAADGTVVTNINTSGVITTKNFIDLFTQHVTYDAAKNKLGITKSGLLTTDDSGNLYSEYVDSDGTQKSATISTIVRKTAAGVVESGITLAADQINFLGKTIINGNFVVDTDGNLTLKNITATNGNFSGKLNGVTGTFKTLECVDANGNSAGSITFGSDQRITFNDADVNQQGKKNGRSLIFSAGDIRCRGSFGAYQHTMACVDGQYISYYVRGCDNITKYIRAKLPTTSYNNIVYCYVPLYPDTMGTYEVSDLTAFGDGLSTSEIYGFPIDILLMKNSANTSDANHYCLIGDYGKEVIIANVDDDQNPVYYARCGDSEAKLSGGTVQHLINAYYMNPSRTLNSIDKPTWMVCGEFDNDW